MNKKKSQKGLRFVPNALQRKKHKIRKTTREKVAKPVLIAREDGSKVAGTSKKKRTGRIIVHFYGWQIFPRQMKSASEFRVVLPYPLSNEEILKRVEQAFGDIV